MHTNKGNVVFALSIFIIFIINITTVSHYPEPWVDEVMYIDPAINLAQQGYPIDIINFSYLNAPYYNDYLYRDLEARKIFTKEKGYFDLGELFIQKDLAKTLKRISRLGYEEFYNGKTAEMIIKCMSRTNGLMTIEDLKNYKPIIREAISFDYRGHTIYSMPPASSGGIA